YVIPSCAVAEHHSERTAVDFDDGDTVAGVTALTIDGIAPFKHRHVLHALASSLWSTGSISGGGHSGRRKAHEPITHTRSSPGKHSSHTGWFILGVGSPGTASTVQMRPGKVLPVSISGSPTIRQSVPTG